ncbi:MAG: RNA methyltransferase, partial [Pseudomonadota bacterium]
MTIKALGRQGHGIGETPDGKDCYVAYALPGETVDVSGKGKHRKLEAIVSASPDRQATICSHFGDCGGCQTQHMQESTYQSWKQQLLSDALNRAGIDVTPGSFIGFDLPSRRKAAFSACHTHSGVELGFTKSSSHEVVDLQHCPVLDTRLQNALPAIRELAALLPSHKKSLRLSVLAAENGIDLSIEGDGTLSEKQRQTLVRKAIALGMARVSFNGETLVETQRPILQMGTAAVTPPPGGFVQSSIEAEAEMAKLVTYHLAPCKSVVDLYCGVGTFALRLAENA